MLRGLDRGDAGQELAGHHAGQADDADDHHGVDDGNHPRADVLAGRLACGFPPRRLESKQGLDVRPPCDQFPAEPVEPQ
jgi:hypothetical protein